LIEFDRTNIMKHVLFVSVILDW